ncbi:hypothetical protein GCM10023329_16460 [Streptomyces sanyensis]|uniref:Uncharacterized protein n=1 Tax=Streptomyces sanyensis TaxID=568869 RepID=A0ABP9A0W0_9ACTN
MFGGEKGCPGLTESPRHVFRTGFRDRDQLKIDGVEIPSTGEEEVKVTTSEAP